MVLLMWFCLSAFIVLVGAELNCEVERASSRQRGVPAGPGTRPGPAETA